MGVCTSKHSSIVHATITVQPYNEKESQISISKLPEELPVRPTQRSEHFYQLRRVMVNPRQKNFKRALTEARILIGQDSLAEVLPEDQNKQHSLDNVSTRKKASKENQQCSPSQNTSDDDPTREQARKEEPQNIPPQYPKKDSKASQATTITRLSDDESTFSLDIDNELPKNGLTDPETSCREIASKLISNNKELRDNVQSLLLTWEETDQMSAIKNHARSASADIANDHLMLAEYLTRSTAKYLQNLDGSHILQIVLAKAFAIYFWICTNIAYDIEQWERYISDKLHKSKNLVEAEAEEVLSSRAAICLGYANLFAEMAKIAGITVEVVEGEASHVPIPALSADSARASTAVPHKWNMVSVVICYIRVFAHIYSKGLCT